MLQENTKSYSNEKRDKHPKAAQEISIEITSPENATSEEIPESTSEQKTLEEENTFLSSENSSEEISKSFTNEEKGIRRYSEERDLYYSSLKGSMSKSSLLSSLETAKEQFKNSLPTSLRSKSEDTKLRVFVAFLFLLILFFVSAAHVAYYRHIGELRIFGRVKLEEADRKILIFDSENELAMEANIGVSFPLGMTPFPCITSRISYNKSFEEDTCLEWSNKARLEITHRLEEEMNCYKFFWMSLSSELSPMDCFPVGESHGDWYGGGESLRASWPLNKANISLSPFVTGDEGQTEWGNVIRKFFLNSKGISLSIEDHTPLFVSLNDTSLCIMARFDNFAYYYHPFNLPKLNYTICQDRDMNALHRALFPQTFWEGHSQRDLNTLKDLIKSPIWQVPLGDLRLSHEIIKRYIEDVIGRNRESRNSPESRGYLLLDYHWQKHMGDMTFNSNSFPDIISTLHLIKSTGFKLVLTINPFVSTESAVFTEGVKERYFVMKRNTIYNVPALTWFKDVKTVALLDITSPQTVLWFKKKLEDIKATLNHEVLFYLDIGNTFHIPTFFNFTVPLDNPDLYGEHFVEKAMEEVSVIGVSGAASKRPKAPAFIFLTPLESRWIRLRTIIPNILHLSTIGYPFVNPGPVGGKTMSTESGNTSVSDNDFELFVRWWQLNNFLPLLHFSKPPSSFGMGRIAKVSKNLNRIRNEVVNKHISYFSNQAMQTSLPVIRPLWMMSSDSISVKIDDEFLIGDKILVAPILHFGSRVRNIYLPSQNISSVTVWKRGSDGTFFKGGQWIKNVAVPLETVMYFIKEDTNTLPGFENQLLPT